MTIVSPLKAFIKSDRGLDEFNPTGNNCIMGGDAIISKVALVELVSVGPGYPFRGSVEACKGAGTLVIQLKDIDSRNKVNWNSLTRTALPGKREPNWLQDDDVLLMSRGARTQAVYLNYVPIGTVCSPHFFLLRVNKPERLLPEFLAWQLNQKMVQNTFHQLAQGSLQHSLSRNVIESIPLVVPSVQKQIQVLELVRCAQKEMETLEKLLQNRQEQINFVAKELLETKGA